METPRVQFSARVHRKALNQLPELKLDHVNALTDDTGMLQHAIFTIPNRAEGYTTDDNARALILTVLLDQSGMDHAGKAGSANPDWPSRYLAFLEHAFNPEKKRFRNFLGYDHRWKEDQGSEDSHGRALWALGTVLARSANHGLRGAAGRLVRVLPAGSSRVPQSSRLRLLLARNSGVSPFVPRRPGRPASTVRIGSHDCSICMSRSGARTGSGLRMLWRTGTRGCPRPCCCVGSACADERMLSAGLESLNWLMETQRCQTNGHFVPIGSQGFYHQGGEQARFDQQPIEAAGAVSACLEAYRVTGDNRWRSEAWSAFNWFLGDNDLQLPLYDSVTGGCRDGLHPDRANENQGAESTLSFLMALLEMRSLQESEQRGIPS